MITTILKTFAPLMLLSVAFSPAVAAAPTVGADAALTTDAAPTRRIAADSIVVAQAGQNAQPNLLGQFGDWGAYVSNNGGRKICYTLGKPASAQTVPPNRPRDPIYMFISTRPAENVRNEVSVILGYPHKPDTDATIEVGSAKFAMYTQNDGAWIKNAAEEPRLIDAMRKGSEVIVRGTSSRGTQTIDRYSLKGISQALDRVSQECR